jgi:hypothetical protein
VYLSHSLANAVRLLRKSSQSSGISNLFFSRGSPRVGGAFSELKIQDLARLPRPADPAWRAAVPALAVLARDAEARAPIVPIDEIDRTVDAAFASA